MLLLLATPYVRPTGLGTPYAQSLPRLSCGALVLLIAVGVVVLLGWPGGALLAVLGTGSLGFRYWLLTRLGGATGDTLGAACELTEGYCSGWWCWRRWHSDVGLGSFGVLSWRFFARGDYGIVTMTALMAG